MRQAYIALGAATFLLAACGGTAEERAATGGLGGAAAGAVVGGPIGAVVGGAVGATGGAVMDEGVDEKIGEATASQATASGADVLDEIKGWDEFSTFSEAIEATVVSRSWWKLGGAGTEVAWWGGSGGEVKVGG